MATHTDRPEQPCGASIVDIRDYFTLWLTKLENFYDERDRANKESVRAAFNAAEKASEKTEQALREYKSGANEWRDTVKDLIAGLKEARATTTGRETRDRESDTHLRDTRGWFVPMVVVGLIAFSDLLINLVRLVKP